MAPAEGAPSSAGATDVFAIVGRTLHERVRVDRVVAEGGFGVVYAGEHLSLGVPVAVKVLKSDDGELVPPRAFVEQFVREARTIARVRHPNIVQVLDVATIDVAGGSVPYMVLEWCDGETLDRWLDRRDDRAMTPREAWSLLRPVADAIATAHDAGVAHRDIKPSNVMVVTTKKSAVAKVLDFGIAKLMDGESAGSGITATQSTIRAYSPLYAAPEQVAGTRTGPWTDVHALALLFVELVLGTTAYRSDSRQWLLQEIMSSVRPTVVHRGLSLGTMDAVIERALAFVPEQRYANAGELVAAMDAVLAEPGVNDVKGSPQRPQKQQGNVEPTVDAPGGAHNVTGPRVSSRPREPRAPARAPTQRDDSTPPPVQDTIAPERTEQPPLAPRGSRGSLSVALAAVALASLVTLAALVTRKSGAASALATPDSGVLSVARVDPPRPPAAPNNAIAAQTTIDASASADASTDASVEPDARAARRPAARPGPRLRPSGGYTLE
jgi:eukaryotic-like serine/threonine-protein kinase